MRSEGKVDMPMPRDWRESRLSLFGEGCAKRHLLELYFVW
jgi:hypothetical protein